MIQLSLTPAEHAHILLRLGRGTGSTIRPGESLSAQEELALVEKVERAAWGPEVDASGNDMTWLVGSSVHDDVAALYAPITPPPSQPRVIGVGSQEEEA